MTRGAEVPAIDAVVIPARTAGKREVIAQRLLGLHEQGRHGVAVIKLRVSGGTEPVLLRGNARQPAGGAYAGRIADFRKSGLVGVVVLLRAVPVVVIGGHGRCAQLQAVALAHRNIDNRAGINALRALRESEGLPVGCPLTGQCSAQPTLTHSACRQQCARSVFRFPEQPRPDRGTLVARDVGPAVSSRSWRSRRW